MRGYSTEAVTDTILRRMPDYVHYITPQFSRTHINFQRVPTVDTSNPFVARFIPTPDESFLVIRFANPRGIDFPYLLSMLHDSFMSRANTIVVPGGKMDLAMQTIFTPLIWRLMERKKQLTTKPLGILGSVLVGITFAKRRKYGGYIVHLGMVMMFFGFAGKAYSRERAVTVGTIGEKWQVDGYTFKYTDLAATANENRNMFTATVLVERDGELIATTHPARWQYTRGTQETTTEVFIDRNFIEDIYLVLNGFDPQSEHDITFAGGLKWAPSEKFGLGAVITPDEAPSLRAALRLAAPAAEPVAA